MCPDSRPPLDVAALRRAVLTPEGPWRALEVLADTASTNADVAAAAQQGAPEGLIVAAEHQRAGRGRAGRGWTAPPRASLAVSVLLRPGVAAAGWPAVPVTRWGWLPLLAGVALAESVAGLAGVTARLKWPNDLLLADAKAAGVLSEVAGGAVVVGIGLNVHQRVDELPTPGPGALPATSLALAGARVTDRQRLLVELLRATGEWYGAWRRHAGDADACGLRAAYQRWCATVDQPVRAILPGGAVLTGTAVTVDGEGRLVLRTAHGTQALAAGDITHLRPVAPRA
ncbi:MAG TPA: biotin--[acetyl-CoA-carboxylase] ligase [Natronosporangium sp.]|nr:biotin--[acetyl-CoA-carboxylase] ligase [Natronosporangium sp.]